MFPSRVMSGGVFPMMALAAMSIVLLVVATLWQSTVGNRVSATQSASMSTTTSDLAANPENTTDEASSTLELTPLGATVLSKIASAYDTLSTNGTYTTETGEAAAREIVPSIKPEIISHEYIQSDLSVSSDSSRARLLAYRTDLQTALQPLLANKAYELSTYAHYIATRDENDLALLQQSALNYHAAILNAASITVPRDAVQIHLRILNALDAFSATLATQITSVMDPYASAALLSSYNTAETEVFLSFDELARFFRDRIPS